MAYGQGPYLQNGGYGYGQMMPQQMQQAYQAAPVSGAIEWVDGEVGARAKQIPMGTNVPIALWDSNEPVIYLRSVNNMGMPNPMKRLRYVIEDEPQKSGRAETARLTGGDTQHDMSEYVRKDELADIKEELLKSIREIGTTGPVSRRARSEEE